MIDASRRSMGDKPIRAESCRDLIGRQPGEISNAGNSPFLEGRGRATFEPEMGEGEGSQERSFFPSCNDDRRLRQRGRDAGCQFVRWIWRDVEF